MSRKLYDNTENLEEVLELLNNKAAGGGGTDTSDATATSADILIDKTAYANGEKITGSIPLQSAKTITPSASEQVAISSGYYASGDVKVQGDANLTADNIKKGATIFGIEGNYEGEGGGGENKLAKVVDGTTVELTAEDLAGVTNIRSYAFYYHRDLTSIVIPDGVTTIGSYAFYNCSKLTSAVIPNSVTAFNMNAFDNCSNLKNIEIPNSVTNISNSCFHSAGLTSVTIPNSVKTIGSYLFQQCTALKSVVIGEGIKIITLSMFDNCDSLTSVAIGNSVTRIDNYAFNSCDSLTSIEIPKSVTRLGNWTFSNCVNLKRVDFSTHTTIPSINATSTFNNTNSALQIKVPANLIDQWKAATNWSNHADKIVTEFTNTL